MNRQDFGMMIARAIAPDAWASADAHPKDIANSEAWAITASVEATHRILAALEASGFPVPAKGGRKVLDVLPSVIGPVRHTSGGNRYCGPAVLSALLGIDTKEAARRLRVSSGKKQVTGTSAEDMKAVLMGAGWRPVVIPLPRTLFPSRGISLVAFLNLLKPERIQGRVFLISAGHHWQIVEGDRLVCSLTETPVPFTHAKVKRRATVKACWELIKR